MSSSHKGSIQKIRVLCVQGGAVKRLTATIIIILCAINAIIHLSCSIPQYDNAPLLDLTEVFFIYNYYYFRRRRRRNKIEWIHLTFSFGVAISQCIIIIIICYITEPDYLKLRKPLTIQKSSSNALPVTKVFSYMRAGGRSGILSTPSPPPDRQYGRRRENRDAKLLLSDKKKKIKGGGNIIIFCRILLFIVS